MRINICKGAAAMSVIITADSTCDLPKDIIESRNIKITPLSILLGSESYLDGEEITRDDIYAHVSKTGEMPKTAAVSPASYYEVFSAASRQGDSVVHISLSSAISSSYQNAVTAAGDFSNVHVVDSKNLCGGMGLLVLKACDLRDKGFDAKKIANRIRSLVPKVHATFVLDNLVFLYKGGRCSAVARFGANVLGIKPVIGVDPADGTMDVIKKYRGKIENVYRQYVNDTFANAAKMDTDRIIIANSGSVAGEITAFAKGVASGKADFKEILTADAGCTISSHCGPKTFAVFYMRK